MIGYIFVAVYLKVNSFFFWLDYYYFNNNVWNFANLIFSALQHKKRNPSSFDPYVIIQKYLCGIMYVGNVLKPMQYVKLKNNKENFYLFKEFEVLS